MIFNVERKGLEKQYYELCKSVLTSENLSLYDMEFVKSSNTLRVFIIDEKTQTALIEDCIRVDKAMGPYIETNDWISDSIVLEVSSPGLFRKLKTHEHFQKSVGNDIEIVLRKDIRDLIDQEIKGLKGKKIKVNLIKVSETDIIFKYSEGEYSLSFDDIKKANLSPQVKF